jgi:hypothetical protein
MDEARYAQRAVASSPTLPSGSRHGIHATPFERRGNADTEDSARRATPFAPKRIVTVGPAGLESNTMRLPWRRPERPPLKTVRHVPPAHPPASDPLSDLEAQARFHRERLVLYRARMHGTQPTSASRLRELEQASAAAEDRLSTARRLAGR